MITVDLYVVVGPTNTFMGGRNVPGGFEYLNRNLSLLAQLNPSIRFNIRIAHSSYHGELGKFSSGHNMDIQIKIFDNNHIQNLDSIDPVIEHGTLLNELFMVSPPTQQFLIILDPDCYSVEGNLIIKLITELTRDDIAVIGLPYPAWYPKEYSWKTPQLYFSLFDRVKLDPSKIDLRAGDSLNSQSSLLQATSSLQVRIFRRLELLLISTGMFQHDNPVLVFFERKISRLTGRYKIDPLDTAWRIPYEITQHDLRSKNLPYIAKAEVWVPGLRKEQYLAKNPDLRHLEGRLGWHLLNHGLIEGRSIGSQGIILRLLRRIMGKSQLKVSKWPSDSLIDGNTLQNEQLFRYILSRIPAADYYATNEKLAFFHLGHKGKGRISGEIQVLDEIISKILNG